MVTKSFRWTVCGGGIIAGALALRLWHLHFGLPEWYHPDEPLKARSIARIAGGDLRPTSLYHPTFLPYAAAVTLRLQHPDGTQLDEQSAVRTGRLTVAVLGTATVALTLLAGARAYDPGVGLVAALLLAIAPLHVVCAHYLKEDVPLAFWTTAVFVASLRIVARGAGWDYLLAGGLAGIAAGTKYSGALFVALPWLAERERAWRTHTAPAIGNPTRSILIAAGAGFLVVTPFALLDPLDFVRGVAHGAGNAVSGMAGISVWPLRDLWTYHLRHSIVSGFGLLPTVLAVVGGIAALRREHAADRLLLATVIGVYLVFESSPYKPPPNADRHVVPLLPFLSLLAASALRAGAHIVHDRRVAAGLFILIVAFPLVASMRLTSAMQPDTRQAAAEWLRQHACGTTRIVVEGALNAGGTLVPSYVPALPSDCRATYVYSLERDRGMLAEADIVVASSFMYDRFLHLHPASSDARRFYERFFASHELLAEFAPRYRSYGFHNPTIRIYRMTLEGAASAAPGGVNAPR